MKKLKKLLSIVLAVAMVMSLAVSVGADDDVSTDTSTTTTTISIKSYATGTESYSAYKIFDVTSNGTGGYAYTIDSNDIFFDVIKSLSTSANNYSENSAETPGYFVLTKVAETDGVATYSVTQNTNRYPKTSESSEETENWVNEEGTGVVITGLVAAIKTYLGENSGTTATISSFTKSTTSGTDTDSTYYTYTATVTEPGYYYITTSAGSVVMVDTAEAGTIVNLTDKNEVPSVKKEVYEGSETKAEEIAAEPTGWDADNDAAIGETVYFKTTINNIYEVSNLVLHDYMEGGLELNTSSITVTLYEGGSKTGSLVLTPESTNETTGRDYTLDTNPTHSTSVGGDSWTTCTFEITFDTAQIAADAATGDSGFEVTKDSYIVVTYSAEVTANAEIYGDILESSDGHNDNATYVSYGEASYTTTDTTETYVYSLKIYKYTDDSSGTAAIDQDTNKLSGSSALSGAEFVIYKIVDSKTYYAVFDNNVLSGWTEYKTEAEATDSNGTNAKSATVLTSDSGGYISVSGLDGDQTYYLLEVEAPSGYNALSSPVEFSIEGSDPDNEETQGTVYYKDSSSSSSSSSGVTVGETENVVPVYNQSGSELPSTGGIGVTIFYVVGGILILAAAGVIVINRKKIKK